MQQESKLSPDELKDRAKTLAGTLGVCASAVAMPHPPTDRTDRLADWLARGLHGNLEYMERSAWVRADLRRWWPEARSVLCVAVPYELPTENIPPGYGRVAGYALGEDYHLRLGQLLDRLAKNLAQATGVQFPYRIAVDSAPVAERSLAASCGLGVIAKNGQLLVPGWGTAVLLGELLLPFGLPPDPPLDWDPCSGCDRCLRACPTGALEGPLVRADKCLSYWTTEQRGPIPLEISQSLSRRLVGCDTCQLVCPHNRNRIRRESSCASIETWTGREPALELASLFEIGGKALGRKIRGTALDRIGPSGLWRNALATSFPGPDFARIRDLSETKNSPLVARQRQILSPGENP